MVREKLRHFNASETQRPYSQKLPFESGVSAFGIDNKVILSADLEVANTGFGLGIRKVLNITTKGFVPIVSEKRDSVLNIESNHPSTGEIKKFSVNITTGKDRITLIGDKYRIAYLMRDERGIMIFEIGSSSPPTTYTIKY